MSSSSSSTIVKRERKKNFNTDEVRVLTEEFTSNKELLTSKFSNTVTNARKTTPGRTSPPESMP